MPQAVAAAIIGFIGLTGTAAAIATSVLSFAITVGAALGINTLTQSLSGKNSVPPSDRQFITRSTVTARVRHYGRVRVAGAQIFAIAVSGIFYRVLAHGQGKIDGIEKYFLDNREITIDGSGYVTNAEYQYRGRSKVKIETRDGGDAPSHYASLGAAVAEWTSDHLGKGVFHSLTAFEQVDQSKFLDMYPSAENTVFKVQFRGAQVYDSRTASTAWSANSALCIRDLITHADGFGMPTSWLDQAGWNAAADDCDDPIPLYAGGTEPRYVLSHSYSFDQRPADVLKTMLASCNGKFLIGNNGGLVLSVGRWVEPTFTIESSMIEGYYLESGNESPDSANIIRSAYVSPEHGYTEQDADPWEDAVNVTLMGAKPVDIPLLAVPSHSQARRLMKQAAALANPEWKGTVVCNLAALPVLSHRFVNLQLIDLGLTFPVEVAGAELRIADGAILTGVSVTFVAMSSNAFSWSASDEGRAPEVAPEVDDGGAIAVPSSASVTVEARSGGLGPYPVAVFEWSGTLDYQVVEIQAQIDGSAQWVAVGVSGYGATSFETGALINGSTYVFRLRTVSNARNSDWVTLAPAFAATDPTAPGVPTGLSTSPSGSDVGIAWTQPSDANTYGARVYRNTANNSATASKIVQLVIGPSASGSYTDESLAAGTYWWWVAAINGSGVESTRTLAGTETIT